MKNPPRRTTIRGQKHLLAYITPEEAKVLKAMGGSGEKVNGIPAFFDPGDRDQLGGAQGDRDVTGRGDGGNERDSQGRDAALEAAKEARAERAAAEAAHQAELNRISNQSPGAMGGAIGSAYQTAPSIGTGFDVQLQKARSAIAASPYTGWVDRMIENAYQTGKAPGLINNLLDVPIGRFQNFKLAPPGYKGVYRSYDMLQPLAPGPVATIMDMFGLPTEYYMTTGWGNDPRDPNMGGEGAEEDRQLLPTQTNPVTGQEECPEGYVFDEDLQACRMGGGGAKTKPYTGDLYGRMGLLDIAPTGLGMFKQRFGAGFGSPSEFDAANLAFRRGGGVMKQHPGYTLLS
jgi:hypothetical protein